MKHQDQKNSFPLENLIPLTRARKEFFSLTDDVFEKSRRFILTDRGEPKAALLPVRYALSAYHEDTVGGASIVSDVPNSYGHTPKHTPFRYDAHSEYRVDFAGRDIVRARLTIHLMEDFGYPESSILIGHSFPLSGNHYIETDVLVHDSYGNVLLVFFVAPQSQFEENRSEIIKDMFRFTRSLSERGQHKLRFVGYYTRYAKVHTPRNDRVEIIDCKCYPTKHIWESAQCPIIETIPLYRDLL
jgi:hypothetical protein